MPSRARVRGVTTLAAITALPVSAGGQCNYEIAAVIRDPGGRAIYGWGMSESGLIVGSREVIGHAYAWWGEGPIEDLPMPPGESLSRAYDVHNDGRVVGYLQIRNDDYGYRAFINDASGTRMLGELPGHNWGEAQAIAADGTIVGMSSHNVYGPTWAVMWIDEQVVSLTPFLGERSSRARDINDMRQVVGSVDQQAYRLDLETGVVDDLGVFPGGDQSSAYAINNRGQVAGVGNAEGERRIRGFFWDRGVLTDIGVVSEHTRTRSYDVNDSGVVVGQCSGGGVASGFVWHEGRIHDLNTLVTEPLPHQIDSGTAITNSGHIVASLHDPTFILLLAPVGRRAGDASGDCVVDMDDVLIVLDDWGPCSYCPSDIDRDGDVDADDLALVIRDWT